MGLRTLGEDRDGSGNHGEVRNRLGEVRDGSGYPRLGPRQVGRPSRRSLMGRRTHGKVRDGLMEVRDSSANL